MIPDNVEKIIMTKQDYDRNIEQLLFDKVKAEQELERYKNIIDELEEWLEDNLGTCRTNQTYTSNQIYNLKEDIYYRCLNKLKELKGSDK